MAKEKAEGVLAEIPSDTPQIRCAPGEWNSLILIKHWVISRHFIINFKHKTMLRQLLCKHLCINHLDFTINISLVLSHPSIYSIHHPFLLHFSELQTSVH